jgi:small neutral amino acid transporter SnatA (MarC family)
MGALIRVTGLVVATIAVQMILSGLSTWRALG